VDFSFLQRDARSAKDGIAIVSRPSVRLSVCNVDVPWASRKFGWNRGGVAVLDDLEGHYELRFKRHASFKANHENLNEDRPILSAARCSAVTVI